MFGEIRQLCLFLHDLPVLGSVCAYGVYSSSAHAPLRSDRINFWILNTVYIKMTAVKIGSETI
jgi:hypothetical protein